MAELKAGLPARRRRWGSSGDSDDDEAAFAEAGLDDNGQPLRRLPSNDDDDTVGVE
ncbi:unnamed protein product, partial [marine sediment metagenome]